VKVGRKNWSSSLRVLCFEGTHSCMSHIKALKSCSEIFSCNWMACYLVDFFSGVCGDVSLFINGKNEKQGVCHTVALPFTLKILLKKPKSCKIL
jgi:hypothetical protein